MIVKWSRLLPMGVKVLRLEGIEAKRARASECYIADLKEKWSQTTSTRTETGAYYEGKYLLGTSAAHHCESSRSCA